MPDPTDATPGLRFPHRLAFAILVCLLVVILFIQYLRRPAPLDFSAAPQLTLPARIDPNTASLPELTRIPHLAESLAGQIIQYREERLAASATAFVFYRPEDLLRIPGLKKKTLDQLLPYLDFPIDHEEPQQQP